VMRHQQALALAANSHNPEVDSVRARASHLR
jgi:hypothetical protein